MYQLNELDFMYRQLSSDMQEEYVSLLTVFENLEALYICRNMITVYHDCKSMIDVARQKLMNDPTFKHLSEDCQEYYFDFEAYHRYEYPSDSAFPPESDMRWLALYRR